MKTIKIFLASSSELKEEREQFEIFINRKNKEWLKSHDIFLHLDIWEDFIDAMSQTRLQDEYNKVIEECDIFVLLAWNKVGMFTAEEFGKAFGQFKETKKPFIYTYFKTPHTSQDRKDLQSLWEFTDKLKTLGHFKTDFLNTEGLKFHFSNQLDKLYAADFNKSDGADSAKSNPDNSNTGSGTNITVSPTITVSPVFNNNPQFSSTGNKNVVSGDVNTGGGDFIVGDNNNTKR